MNTGYMQIVFDEIRDEVDLDVCRNCQHWTDYPPHPDDDPNLAGECNNFDKPRECQGVVDELIMRRVAQ